MYYNEQYRPYNACVPHMYCIEHYRPYNACVPRMYYIEHYRPYGGCCAVHKLHMYRYFDYITGRTVASIPCICAT